MQTLGAVGLLVGSTLVVHAQSAPVQERLGVSEYSVRGYSMLDRPAELGSGRSVGATDMSGYNCRRGEPSISPNGNPSLTSNTSICR
jgi:hypothetical protein